MNVALALMFILISSIFGAFSTLLFKLGAGLKINLQNYKLMGAFILAGVSFVFYIYALQQASLTFIYLTASISYIWAIILAKTVLKEQINKYKIIGISLILLGIVVMHL
ncbi:MAG TPA: EamA family transporter [Candidatus Nanoarchaeia archaeon]|nr:EamA family transporter [Candidatus Nanoarchaeia archaeon]